MPLAIAMTAIIGARVHDGVPLIHLLRPAIMLGVVGGALAFLYTRREVIRRALRDPVFQAAAMYIGWAGVTVPFAMWVGGAVKAYQGAIPALVLLFTILLCPPTRRVVDTMQRGFVLACTGTAINALIFGVVGGEGRLTTLASLDANDLAAVMAMALPLGLGLMSRDRSPVRKVLWAVCVVLQVFVFMKAGSRGGMLAIAMSAVLFVAGQRGARRVGFAVLCVAGGIAAWGLGSDRFQEKMRALIRGEQDYNYTAYSGRKQVWARARGYTLQNPVFGVGIGNFPIAEGESCRRDFPDSGCKWSATHNSWFQASAELGVPGAILFGLMLLRGMRAAYKLWVPRGSTAGMHLPEYFAALGGFCTSATFLSHAYFYLLFALLGLIALAAQARALQASRVPVPAGAGGWAGRPAGMQRRPVAPRPFGHPAPAPQRPFAPAPMQAARGFGRPRR